MRGSARFHEILEELGDLHDKKQQDYGRPNDPFSNVRASEDFGVPGWVGCMMRANDKMRRIQKAAQGGALANEAVEDSLRDLAVYAIIGLCLFEELPDNPAPPANPDDYAFVQVYGVNRSIDSDLDAEVEAAFARIQDVG